jgi:hypothetical protein
MPGYYAYFLGKDGHIVRRVDIVCDGDEEAVRHTERMVDGHDIELWQQARLIRTFPSKD